MGKWCYTPSPSLVGFWFLLASFSAAPDCNDATLVRILTRQAFACSYVQRASNPRFAVFPRHVVRCSTDLCTEGCVPITGT